MPELWDVLDKHGNKTGRLHERGKPLAPGDYMLIVHVWKHNGRGQWLIDKRAPRGYGHMDGKWETTGGCAIAGDDSLTAALRETKEELGITLDPGKGTFYKRIPYENFFVDVWVFEHDCPIGDIVFQESETTAARWAAADEIRVMMAAGDFLVEGRQGPFYPYFDEMVAWVERK
ncbi:MAG: NUDIX domain-containing protein [Defluviitaleaceae bacterium]|nr:NUDIX domain-containing protein [Defluviitaleaceae bacterium]